MYLSLPPLYYTLVTLNNFQVISSEEKSEQTNKKTQFLSNKEWTKYKNFLQFKENETK